MRIDSTATMSTLPRTWDCVVIGGGLAGAMAARGSAQRGLRTLVIERKLFPRAKVCGACLNHRALSVLRNAGLEHVARDCGGVPIQHFLLRGYGRQFERSIPEGIAVSRAEFDAALMRCAIESGVEFMSQVSAKVLPADGDAFRVVRLSNLDDSLKSSDQAAHVDVQAKVVVAADGLGHPSLRLLPEFSERISPRSRVGIGTTMDDLAADWIAPGTIHMAVGRHGYTGLVRVEAGRVNVAAAVTPESLKGLGSPQAACESILREAGFPDLNFSQAQWTGTPSLSRSTNRVADNRVLVVGDAAGYVEPFTGEGMTWAITGGHIVAAYAAAAVTNDAVQAAGHWQNQWDQLVYRRQTWCRRLAWLLRHPQAARLGLAVVAKYPAVTDSIVKQMNLELSV